MRFLDPPGGTSAQGLAALRATDALCLVLRAFGPDPNPAGELAEIRADLLLSDLAMMEGALENARRRLKGRGATAFRPFVCTAPSTLGRAGAGHDGTAAAASQSPGYRTMKPAAFTSSIAA